MSVLVYVEIDGSQVKTSSLEAVVYASKISEGNVTAVATAGAEESSLAALGAYGASKVLLAGADNLKEGSIQAISTLVAEAAKQEGAKTVVMARSSMVDAIASRIAIKLQASVAANVVALPDTTDGFKVRRGIYTGKAFAEVELPGETKVLTLKKGAVEATPVQEGATAEVADFSPAIPDSDFSTTRKSVEKAEGDILLPEADRVVSAGRGLKGPENWGMIEDLAKTLTAATACSKPVSDMDWRPHHEHVGQTGIKVSPNLYIAVGISGAIQHLAGVNSSKVIVAINKDSEAPFFKAADYGIVGDAFEVVPKLNEAIKNAIS